ncbi:thioredoxin family protein [Owenweeksia hongkongensis]|uniref:thioredoxin family protein n=1 Tax=Owenweeksia hongkongensis TaxID=253245 RepID=UPI003A93B026
MDIINKAIENSMSYTEYRELIDRLRANNKTTGDNHSEDMLNYTDLNIARMNKWDKRFVLDADVQTLLKNIEKKETWIVLTEAWCGDAAHSVPVMAKMADACENIDLHLVLRDENLELMDKYLTNGGRSIPKLIRLDAETGEELSTWGPRPKESQDLFTRMKKEGFEKADINKDLQLWYARNSGKAIEQELAQMLSYQLT